MKLAKIFLHLRKKTFSLKNETKKENFHMIGCQGRKFFKRNGLWSLKWCQNNGKIFENKFLLELFIRL